MTEVVKKNIKDSPSDVAAPKIDARAIILEPIDFSFKDMLNLEGRTCSCFGYTL